MHVLTVISTVVLLPISAVRSLPITLEDIEKEKAKTYLQYFGYYSELPEPRGTDVSEIQLENAELSLAIKHFQLFAGLPLTGELDADTTAKMKKPRCGVADVGMLQRDGGEPRWTKDLLTWTIDDYSKHLDKSQVRRAMHEATHIWSQAVGITFRETTPDDNYTDLRIKFGSREHGDPWPFDGEGIVLAHALFPPDGRIHFDDDEKWKYDYSAKWDTWTGNVDLLTITVHELGHALGLGHIDNINSIMHPFYQPRVTERGTLAKPELYTLDIQKIQRLYDGVASRKTLSRTTTTTKATTTTPTTTVAKTQAPRLFPNDRSNSDGRQGFQPESCPIQIDAALNDVRDKTFVFADQTVYEYMKGLLVKCRPIKDVFPNGPSRVTAAVSNTWNSLNLLIEDRVVYAYEYFTDTDQFRLDQHFPKVLPKNVDFTPRAAFTWKDGNQVLTDGQRFATYDEGHNISLMVGETEEHFGVLPTSIRAATRHRNDRLLTIFDDENVHMYSMDTKTVESTQPLSRHLFCDCGSSLWLGK